MKRYLRFLPKRLVLRPASLLAASGAVILLLFCVPTRALGAEVLIGYADTWLLNQTGTNLGSSWREPGFDDSSWVHAPGVFGFPLTENLLGFSVIRTVLQRFINGSSAPQVLTHYFRYHFTISNGTEGIVFYSTNLLDDGAVFYLNGVEVGRFGMPAGPVDFNTLSTRSDDISQHGLDILSFPATNLVAGDNVLAVELHPGNPVSGDAVFGSVVWIDQTLTGPISIRTQPANQLVSVGARLELTPDVSGIGPHFYQWFKAGVLLEGATNVNLIVTNAGFDDSGDYYLSVSNLTSRATTRTAVVSVAIARFHDAWRYDASGIDRETAWRAVDYDDSLWSAGPGAIGQEDAAIGSYIRTVVPLQGITYYFRKEFFWTSDLLEVSLSLSNLIDDAAIFYINDRVLARVGMNEGPVTANTPADRSIGDALFENVKVLASLRPGRNVVAVEVHQVQPNSTDMIFGSEIGLAISRGPVKLFTHPANVILFAGGGFNLAVEATGTSPISYQWLKDGLPLPLATNRTFDVSLANVADTGDYIVVVSNVFGAVSSRTAVVDVLPVVPVIPPLVGSTNLWRYDASGLSLGTAWREPGYDDRLWLSGRGMLGVETAPIGQLIETPLPLRNPDGVSILTYYFRTTFHWTNETLAADFRLSTVIDDGAVFYLNGNEILRVRLPAGQINASTLASEVVDATFEDYSVPVSLRRGENLLAVELHQPYLDSSDALLGVSARTTDLAQNVLLFSALPVNSLAFEGQGAAVISAVVVSGSPHFSQWYRNGTLLPGATNDSLLFDPVRYQDRGVYALTVSNSFGIIQAPPVRLTVVPIAEAIWTAISFTNNWRFHDLGEDLGTAWRDSAFDDSAWPVGRGIFAANIAEIPEPTNTWLRVSNSAGQNVITHYFRTRFSMPQAGIVDLLLSNLVADAAIIYLNDLELSRIRLPSGVVTATTRASTSSSGRQYEMTLVTNVHLPAGDNLLAVELHQSTGVNAGTVAFGLQLQTYPLTAQAPVVVREPQSQVVALGAKVELAPGIFGSIPLHFQWSKDGQAIPGATNRVLTFIAISTNQSGNYYLRVTNSVGGVRTAFAEVVVDPSIIPHIRLTRGPYLQLGTPTNIIVKWRTDLASFAEVHYGTNASNLNRMATVSSYDLDHAVSIPNLTPDTRYFYSIGTTHSNLAGGEGYYFVTAPGNVKPTRIWALGDSGTANQFSKAVAAAYTNYTGSRDTDVWLMLGDNAYYSGLDSEYQAAVFDIYPKMLRRTVLWATIGNHETYSADGQGRFAYQDVFTLPTEGQAGGMASGTENHYSFDYGNIHFICLDSEISSPAPGSSMLTWLEADLSSHDKDWVIVFWHSPPYSHGSHNSDDPFSNLNMIKMRENVVPLLEMYDVDLVLCGHSHSYERSYLLNGHYGYSPSLTASMIKDGGDGRPSGTGPYRKTGTSSRQGTVYVVSGSAGQVFPFLGEHPAMYIGVAQLGSVVIDIDGQRLDAKFLRETGVIDDSFTMIKGSIVPDLQFIQFQADTVVRAFWTSVVGERYRLETSPQLEIPTWLPASDWIEAIAATTSWTNSRPTAATMFYRVMQQEN